MKAWPAMTLDEVNERLTGAGMPFEIAEADVGGRLVRVWKNAPSDLREIFENTRRAYGDQTFLVYQGERVTFEAFSRASLVLAEKFQRCGAGKGDRVAIVMRNLPEWPVVMFAATLAGCIATAINAWGTGENILAGLEDSGSVILVADSERWDRILTAIAQSSDSSARCKDLRTVFVSRNGDELPALRPSGGSLIVENLSATIGEANSWISLTDRPRPDVAIQPDDISTIFYTSGTTGLPKGVMQTHRNAVSTLMVSPFSLARSALRAGNPLPGAPVAGKASLLAVPLFHTTGCHLYMLRALINGHKLVLMHRWDAIEAMRLIERERVTTFGGVPTIVWNVLDHPDREQFDLTSIEIVTFGGAPSSPALVEKICALIPNAAPSTGWGMTETTAAFTHFISREYVNRPGSAGPCTPVSEMQIVGGEGETLAPGSAGELWVRGPNCAKGYWQKPEETAKVFVDGWVRTGDIAYLDEEGFLYLVDRKKDMMIRGGENIFCAEIESALYNHPAILDVAVVARAHPTLGEEPVAMVNLKAGMSATQEEIQAVARASLAAFKIPVEVVFVDEALERNANGKLNKAAIRLLYAALVQKRQLA